jgi:hypothetical protein
MRRRNISPYSAHSCKSTRKESMTCSMTLKTKRAVQEGSDSDGLSTINFKWRTYSILNATHLSRC